MQAIKVTNKSVVHNTGLNILGQVLPLGIGLASAPFIIRGLGPELFGILGLVWVVLAYSSLFELGIGKAVTKLVSEDSDMKEKSTTIVWSAVSLQLVLGWIGAVILFLSAPTAVGFLKVDPILSSSVLWILWTVGLSLPIVLVSGALRGALEGKQLFIPVNFLKTLNNGGLFIVPVVGLVLDQSLVTIVLWMVVLKGLVGVGYLGLCLREFPLRGKGQNITGESIRKIIGFGWWASVYQFSLLSLHLDRIVIGAVIGLSAVSYYTIAYEVSTKLWIIPTALSVVLLPSFSSLDSKRSYREIVSIFKFSVGRLLVVTIPIVLAILLLGGFLLEWYLGAEIREGASLPLQILAVGVLINCAAFVPYSYFQGIGRPDIPAKIVLGLVPVYLGLVIVFGYYWELIGVSFAWLTWSVIYTVLILVLSYQWLLRTKTV